MGEKELELKIVRSPTESHSNTYNVKSDKPRALTMNYLRSPTNLSSQRTPSRNKGNISKSLTAISPGRSHLDFDHILNKMEAHKSQSPITISSMNLNLTKDATPTPAVSPNGSVTIKRQNDTQSDDEKYPGLLSPNISNKNSPKSVT